MPNLRTINGDGTMKRDVFLQQQKYMDYIVEGKLSRAGLLSHQNIFFSQCLQCGMRKTITNARQ